MVPAAASRLVARHSRPKLYAVSGKHSRLEPKTVCTLRFGGLSGCGAAVGTRWSRLLIPDRQSFGLTASGPIDANASRAHPMATWGASRFCGTAPGSTTGQARNRGDAETHGTPHSAIPRAAPVPDIRKVDLPEARQAIPYMPAYLREGILDGTLTPSTRQFG